MFTWRTLAVALILASAVAGWRSGAHAQRPTTTTAQAPARTAPAQPAPTVQAPAPQAPAVQAPTVPATQAPAPSRPYDPYIDGAPALDPIDPLMPEPSADVPGVWKSLDKSVRSIAAGYQGRMSVVAVDLKSGARYEFRPHDRYYPASTFKLPVTLCVLEAIQRGELTWETAVEFTRADDDTVGQGGFATTKYGTWWPVRNLVDRSLISSNNVAVKMLARTLTWDGLKRCTEAMGGMVTRTEDGSTPVTAGDEAAWWMRLWTVQQERPAAAENLLRPLRQVPYWGRIQAGTPHPELVTHKFGTYPPYEHDGAIVWGKQPYILVVLTHGGSHDAADGAIAQVATAAWNSIMTAK